MFQHKMRLCLQVGLVIAGLTVLFGCTSMVGTDLQTNSTSTLTDEFSTQIAPEAKTANFRHMTIQPACLGQKEVHGAVRRAGITQALKDPQVRQILQDLAAQGVRFNLKDIKIGAKVLKQGQNLWVLLPLPVDKVISYQSAPNVPPKVILLNNNNNQISVVESDAIQAMMANCRISNQSSWNRVAPAVPIPFDCTDLPCGGGPRVVTICIGKFAILSDGTVVPLEIECHPA